MKSFVKNQIILWYIKHQFKDKTLKKVACFSLQRQKQVEKFAAEEKLSDTKYNFNIGSKHTRKGLWLKRDFSTLRSDDDDYSFISPREKPQVRERTHFIFPNPL